MRFIARVLSMNIFLQENMSVNYSFLNHFIPLADKNILKIIY